MEKVTSNWKDLGHGNVSFEITCPHCGLKHLVVFAKIREKKK